MSENPFKTWMADLPQETTRVPLCSLAIPGKKYNNKRETTLDKLVTFISESFYKLVMWMRTFFPPIPFFVIFVIVLNVHAPSKGPNKH